MRPFYRLALLAIIAMPTMGLADDTFLAPMSNNIPYIMEVSYRYIDGPSKILSWEVR